MLQILFSTIFIFLSFTISILPGFAADVPLNSQESIDAKASDFVEQVIRSSLLKKTGDIVDQAVRTNNLQLLPQSAYQVVQFTVKNIFEHPQLQARLRDVYQKGMDDFHDKQDKNASSDEIDQSVKQVVNHEVDQIILDRNFHYVLEQMMQIALTQDKQALTAYALEHQGQSEAPQKSVGNDPQKAMKDAFEADGVWVR